MVVVATPNYVKTDSPVVVRVRNAAGNSFEMKVDSTDGTIPNPVDVYYMVVEEGVYTQAADGVQMEAHKMTSTVTDENDSWVGQSRPYSNAYTDPVVLGQVMSANDPDWSVFWSQGSDRTKVPTSSVLSVGKHVGADADTVRADETIGYIVIESGSGTISGVAYWASVGSDKVRGMGDSPPYTYALGATSQVSTAIAIQTGMDGADGGWAVLY
jgi:hypothetical protein